MKIGFIGLGNLGKAICTRLSSLGDELIVYNRNKEKIKDLYTEPEKISLFHGNLCVIILKSLRCHKMRKVKLTVTCANCRCGYHNTGDSFIVEDICPPLCHELWNSIYPSVYTLLNDGLLDCGEKRAAYFDAKCPDGGRVCIHGEVISE